MSFEGIAVFATIELYKRQIPPYVIEHIIIRAISAELDEEYENRERDKWVSRWYSDVYLSTYFGTMGESSNMLCPDCQDDKHDGPDRSMDYCHECCCQRCDDCLIEVKYVNKGKSYRRAVCRRCQEKNPNKYI